MVAQNGLVCMVFLIATSTALGEKTVSKMNHCFDLGGHFWCSCDRVKSKHSQITSSFLYPPFGQLYGRGKMSMEKLGTQLLSRKDLQDKKNLDFEVQCLKDSIRLWSPGLYFLFHVLHARVIDFTTPIVV